ncbi:MAG: efflux RND transporter periplasmic adaptor subunit, partial [Alphaproteobacteria bacterium]|nr:efflux RND transporter periplasmic adaptor subunit [Alphaproteobacteria bacterium]
VNIKSRVDSQIVDVLFHDGDNVKQGQTLFKLDDRALLAQMKQLEANVQKEKAQLENDRLQYQRSQKLIATKAVSQSQLDTTKAAYESQTANVSATQASLDNTRVLLSYTAITAPISGRAGTINVTRGNNVKANDAQALVTINRVQPIRVQFAIPERYYAAVKAQMATGSATVEARREDVKDAATGKLEYIDNTIDPNTGAFAARAVFENADEALWPGMFVQVALNLGAEKAALTIPSVALQGDENAHFVFKVDAAKKAVKTPVTLSATHGTTAIISDGLAEGDAVIVDGLLKVTDGATVATGATTGAP